MQSALTGFARSLANEMPDLRPRWIDLDPDDLQPDALAAELLSNGIETEVAVRGGKRFGCRLNACAADALPRRRLTWNPQTRATAFQLTMPAPGVIDHLYLDEIPQPAPGPNAVLVETHAAGLNFRDVMAASGLLPEGAEDAPAWKRLGMECAGIVRAVGAGVDPDWLGRRILAVAPGSFASHVVVPQALAFEIPDALSFEDAVSIPTAFATARYALVTLARLCEGESVLIHSAAGGVGLAAVAIAKARKIEVFATAGDETKRQHLRGLGIEHVFDSRSPVFADEIMRVTGGRGVDAVLNSLPGLLLEKSLSVLAAGGRFLEIGKRDIYADTPIGLHALRRNVAFFAIDLARIAVERPGVLRNEIAEIVGDLARGRLQPLPVTVFPVAEAAAAFHHMARARHIGKIVMSLDHGPAVVLQRRDATPAARSDATYLITGGTSGFGLATARWLASCGARSLVLVGRSASLRPESAATIADLKAHGVNVVVVRADVASEDGVRAALTAVEAEGLPLRGIIHAAGVIDDALLAELSGDQTQRVFGAKVLGAWHLHEATQHAPLDFFVLFSSVAAAIGTIGQSHYAAANRALDALAAYRRSRGLPALSVNWGPIKDCGYLADRPDIARYMENGGMRPALAEAALSQLSALLQSDPVSVVQADVDWSKLARGHVLIATSPRTAHLCATGANDNLNNGRFAAGLASLGEQERAERVTDFLRSQVAAVLKVEPRTVEPTRPLNELGLDSLTSFELKNRVEAELGISLPIGKFLQRPTIAGIVPSIVERIHGSASLDRNVLRERGDLAGPVMSPGQESLWFIDQLDSSSTAYGLAMCVSVRPKLAPSLVDEAFRRVVMRHESMRLAFVTDGIGPLPTYVDIEAFHIVRHDASSWSEAELRHRLDMEANRRFWLAIGPLVELHLFQRNEYDIILLHLHHIVADATSVALIVEEMFETYVGLGAGMPAVSPAQDSRFSEFAAWQHRLLAGPEADAHRQFWLSQLADAPPGIVLPTDRPRPQHQAGPGGSRNFLVDSIGTEELTRIARSERSTLFAVLLAAFNILLHRESGEDDLIVGVPVNGRTRPEFERVVGHLVNTLPLRTKISGAMTFREVLHGVDAALRAALEHQDYPFARIVKDAGVARNIDRPPIFQVMFGMERAASIDERGITVTLLNAAGPTVKIRDFTVAAVPLRRERAQFDFTFTVEAFDGQIYGVVDYRSDLWNADSIDRLIENYCDILRVLARDAGVAVAEFDRSRAPVLTGPSVADSPDVIDSIRTAAANNPDGRAVIGIDAELTYRELVARAEALAAGLQARGIGAGDLVALHLERTTRLPVAMLGVLMAGSAYVPIDPSYPDARIAAILLDTEPVLVIADSARVAIAGPRGPVAGVDDLLASGYQPPISNEIALAYIIHTSGSTGRPAGVEVYRSGLNNFLAGMRLALPLNRSDRLLAITTPAFDIAALELLLPLTIGASVIVADAATARDGRALSRRLGRGDITVMQATPATWQMLINDGWSGSGRLHALCGGERLPLDLARAVRSRVGTLWNLYGPTETTIWSSLCEVRPDAGEVTLGHPIANTEFRVVTDELVPVPLGAVGELLIGGPALARGYRNDASRNEERFIIDPQDPERCKRLFRTGDMVRVRGDGSLVFVGRRDDQVKIRGFRVELGEIEAALREHPAVAGAAAVAAGDSLAARHIAAFVVPNTQPPADGAALLEHLRGLLPAHMVPASIRIVDALPRTLNGKVDRKRLVAESLRLPAPEGRRSSRGPVEEKLAAILADVLGHDSFDRDDDFFSMGGTSLLGMRYVARIGAAFGVEIDARDLMQASTIKAMAHRIAARSSAVAQDVCGGAGIEPVARALWRPLALAHAEGAFARVDAAAIAYLPDDLLQVGAHRHLRESFGAASHWSAVGRSDLGTLAVVTVPRFGRELLANADDALPAIERAIDQAVRLGARKIALTGIIPAVTELGAALTPRPAAVLTTGHATTACAMVLSIATAARTAGRDLSAEAIAFVGMGAIGTATLHLMLDRLPPPRSLVLCDVPSKRDELEALARDIAKSGIEVRVVEARQYVPEEVYQTRFIVGATNAPDVVEVDRLRPGTVIVDDSFPHCFDLKRAVERYRRSRDILTASGGRLAPPPGLRWLAATPPDVAIAMQHIGGRDLLPSSDEMAGCMLSALLSEECAPPTTGRVTLEVMRSHWNALQHLGIGAAPLRCGSWSPDSLSLTTFQRDFRAA